MVDDHRLLDSHVDPAQRNTDVTARAMGAAREQALDATENRALLLNSCIAEVSRLSGAIGGAPLRRQGGPAGVSFRPPVGRA